MKTLQHACWLYDVVWFCGIINLSHVLPELQQERSGFLKAFRGILQSSVPRCLHGPIIVYSDGFNISYQYGETRGNKLDMGFWPNMQRLFSIDCSSTWDRCAYLEHQERVEWLLGHLQGLEAGVYTFRKTKEAAVKKSQVRRRPVRKFSGTKKTSVAKNRVQGKEKLQDLPKQ